MSEQVVSDFKGKDDLLIQSIDSLLEMDAKGILVPHGIGGHARTLLRAAKASIEQACAARTVPDEKMVAFIKEVSEQKPEKPDYWSSCSQCSSNQSEAEDIILSLAAAPEPKK